VSKQLHHHHSSWGLLSSFNSPDINWRVKNCWEESEWFHFQCTRVSFYDDSHLRHLSNRTEPSRLMVRHCRDSSVLFSTQCVSSSFPLCMCFFYLYFSAVILSWLWFFHSWRPSKRKKRGKNQNSLRHILSWCLLNHGLGGLQQNKKWFDIFSIICVIFYIHNSLN